MGTLVLMGSGELTTTMVEVHKMLVSHLPKKPEIVFIDTPAGFQPNTNQISDHAVTYFKNRIGCKMNIASYKSHDTTSTIDGALAFQQLRKADYILMGPGSPTYTVNQLQPSPVPQIFIDHILKGGCLVTASAAALTTGRFTLPVYEIYKVGTDLHWTKGLDILSTLGLNLVVIPHWNNAEGGTHDTSRCFMGKQRYQKLLSLLPEPLPILGIDEHTACIIDFSTATFEIHGIGTATIDHNGNTQHLHSGNTYPLDVLKDSSKIEKHTNNSQNMVTKNQSTANKPEGLWEHIHLQANDFQKSLSTDDTKGSAKALLELDRILWQAQGNQEDPDIITQARDLYREQLAIIGTKKFLNKSSSRIILTPLVDSLLALRQRFREENNYLAADAIRDALTSSGIIIKDTQNGYQWSQIKIESVKDH